MARRISISEADLVALLKDKDQRGFTILYNNYSATLYGVLKKIIQSEDDANDLLQDTFLKIWKNIDNYDVAKGSIFTWMLNIARNLAIDKVRSVDFRDTSQNISIENKVLNQIDAEYQTAQEVDGIGLQKIVDKLKPEYKHLIELIYYKGYTQAEVAKEYDLPLGTVKTRIKTAVSSLRSLLQASIFVLINFF